MSPADADPDRGADLAIAVETASPVLGTVLEVRIGVAAGDGAVLDGAVLDAVADRALRAALDEIDRLEPLLSVHDPRSGLWRWREGLLDDDALAPEAVALLDAAAHWFAIGHGAYNPCTDVVAALWRRAATDGRLPDAATLDAAARSIAVLPYEVRDGRVRRISDCRGVDLDAIAKGDVVDRALTAVLAADPGIEHAVVNLGGDLRHAGRGRVLVAIEDPLAAVDNAPPLTTVAMREAALATSGSTRRGFQVGEQRFGHVLDPRTGRPVEDVASVSVIAPDARTADVLATIIGVLGPVDGLAFADAVTLRGAPSTTCVPAFLVDASGRRHCNHAWTTFEERAPRER